MIDFHSRILTNIKYQSIAVFRDPNFFRRFFRFQNYIARHFFIRFAQSADRPDMQFRDYQKMNRRLGMNVFENDEIFVFGNYFRRNFFIGNFAKYTIHCNSYIKNRFHSQEKSPDKRGYKYNIY